MADALRVRGLEKAFGEVRVLHGVDAAIAPGEFLVLVGPSGCGKSTLLNCIAGLEETTGGTIEIMGRDVTRLPPRDRDIAMVFQSYALYPTMSVGENIAFGMRVRGVPAARRREKVDEVARLLRIEPLLDRRPSQLSGGQRQRVAMGRALVRDPALFLFDEPLSNLDAALRVEMRAEIRRLHQSTGASIVYVTHDQIEAMTLATRIVVLDRGVVQQAGTPEEIYDRPANAFVAGFMGSPAMNLVPARAEGGRLVFDEGRALELGELPASVRGREVVVGVRPEAFALADGAGGLRVEPDSVEKTGSDTFLRFQLGGRPVTARLPARAGPLGPGTALAVDPARLCFFEADGAGRRLAP